ncbi:MAG: Holliday junction branch migration protein RuvA, partial [Candidatus Komeilibacteria bacterium]|nr:Holliday junction branch migration protein RuvA [Candidatus Komeilibacteria bacterium]
INLANAKMWPVGSEVEIETYLAVREDALDLYGFASAEERGLFKHFLSVSGIGPKTALHLLSLGSAVEIKNAIGRGDLDYLTRVSGIGKKIAERIVMELKSKLASSEIGLPGDGVLGDVVGGLMSLGYTAAEAREVVKNLDATGKSSEQLLKEALQRIK